MNEQMFEAILQLVKEGGQAAVYITIIHYIVGLTQFVVGMGLIGYIASKICNSIKYGIDHSKSFK